MGLIFFILKDLVLRALIVRLVIFGVFVHYSASANSCADTFSKTSKTLPLDPQIFAEQITKGMLLREGQDELFKFYINNFFSHTREIDISLQKVFNLLKTKYSKWDLSKLPVREQIIQFVNHKYPMSDELKDFVSSFRKTSGQIRNNLFQVEANYGFWIKLLDFPAMEVNPFVNKNEQNKKEQTEKYKNNFINYLNTTVLNKEVRDFIKDTSQNYQERTIVLYKILEQIKKSLPNDHKSKDQKISQVMVELVHVAGFGNKFLVDQFKNQDTMQNIDTVKKILKERNLIAQKLGFNHFIELKNSLNGKIPDIENKLQEISKHILESPTGDSSNGSQTLEAQTLEKQTFRLRVLSLQESPYRSCLSGDCASIAYFERALDPNYLYFTLTDKKEHWSSGHVAVVLGTAKIKGRWGRVKVAFVDKIQNIPAHQVSAVLEGIRLSLKEQDYQLALPVDVGNHNGLSNDENLRFYIKEYLLPQLDNPLNSFKPHSYNKKDLGLEEFLSHYYFDDYGWSRAKDRLKLLEWKGIELENATISAGDFPIIRNASPELNIKSFSNYLLSLTHSTKEEDQIKFLKLITQDHLIHAINHIYSILGNKNFSFAVRKKAFFKLIFLKMEYFIEILEGETDLLSKVASNNFWDNGIYFLEKNISFFSDSEIKTIKGEMSNWIHTPDYRRDFISQISYLKSG